MWQVVEDNIGVSPDILIVSTEFDTAIIIAEIGGGLLSERRKHARLIATSPCLLAACEALLEQVERFQRWKPAGEYEEVIEAARKAIAKAKGNP